MKKRKPVRAKVSPKKRILRKKWYRGKIDRGTIFIVVIMITLMFCGYIFVGGTIPETIPKPRTDGIVSIEKNQTYKPEQGLQMHTFRGVTNTPYPTNAPPAPQPESAQITETACGHGITGTAKPELIWAYRISSTAASGNTQSVQIFYAGTDTLAAGTTAMTQRPTQHIVNPPVNAANKDANGYPISPAVFITDITANPADVSGDAQGGGVAQFPTDIYGAWRVENGLSGTVPNGQNLGAGADLWPPANGPAAGARSSVWSAQLIWKVPNLRTKTGAPLTVGNTYRMQIVLHSGTQNREVAELCTTFKL